MKKIWKIATIIMFFSILCIFPIYAVEREDEVVFGEGGRFGSVYGEEYTNETGEVANWLTLQLGERGIRIVNEENREIVIVDKYGGIYLNGDVYVNGEKYIPVIEQKGKLNIKNGFLYFLIVISNFIAFYALYINKKNRR